MFKVINRNTRRRCEICSRLIIKTLERCHWRRSGSFIVNFEYNFTPFSSVSIINYEQVNAGWVFPVLTMFMWYVNKNHRCLERKGCRKHRKEKVSQVEGSVHTSCMYYILTYLSESVVLCNNLLIVIIYLNTKYVVASYNFNPNLCLQILLCNNSF